MSHARRPTFWIVLFLLVAPLGFGGCDGDGEAESAGKEWQLSLEPRDDGTLLTTDRFELLFENQKISKPIEGTIRVAGPGTSSFTLGDGAISTQYGDGAATINFGGHAIHIINNGNAIRIGEVVYQLESGTTNIVIGADGTTRINPD